MYLLFHSVSESLLTSILLFIAYGWTITFTKDAEFDIYIPLGKFHITQLQCSALST
jgi:hypothetical protein